MAVRRTGQHEDEPATIIAFKGIRRLAKAPARGGAGDGLPAIVCSQRSLLRSDDQQHRRPGEREAQNRRHAHKERCERAGSGLGLSHCETRRGVHQRAPQSGDERQAPQEVGGGDLPAGEHDRKGHRQDGDQQAGACGLARSAQPTARRQARLSAGRRYVAVTAGSLRQPAGLCLLPLARWHGAVRRDLRAVASG